MSHNINSTMLFKFVQANKTFMLKENQDWLTVFSGWEGSGKSTLAAEVALMYDPEFDAKTQAIYDLTSFLDFLDMYEKVPGKVGWLDEACLAFLGEDSNTKEAKYFKKVFITHRDLNKIFLFCAPSPWLLTPYIRQWRVRDLLLIYGDNMDEDKYQRYYAYYSKREISKFINSKKAKEMIIVPQNFVEKHKPTMKEPFNKSKSVEFKTLFDQMFIKKKEAQARLRQDIRDFNGVEDGIMAKDKDAWLMPVCNAILKTPEKYIREYHNKTILKDVLLQKDFNIGGRKIAMVKQFVLPQLQAMEAER